MCVQCGIRIVERLLIVVQIQVETCRKTVDGCLVGTYGVPAVGGADLLERCLYLQRLLQVGLDKVVCLL